MNNIRLEIAGGIAAGKTSLAFLSQTFKYSIIYESFTNNPFWGAFYSDPAKFAFETEITFTLQHYHQLKSHPDKNAPIVCDYSFLLDMAYAEMGLKGSQLEAFKAVYAEIQKELPPPALVIHLQCDPDVELARIRARGREVEKNITVDFLRALNEAVLVQIDRAREQVPVLTIDSARNNFVDDEDVKRRVLQMVADALPPCGA